MGDAGKIGLILSGGGARAAYQVGVLMAIADLLPRGARNPFPVICGTSAGALNAAGLAAHAHNYRMGVRGLERVWSNLTADQVYRTDLWSFLRSFFRWMLFAASGTTPVNGALLDSRPLRKLLSLIINFPRIQQSLERGDLEALSITASCYANGESVAFFQARDGQLREWQRARRFGRRSVIGVEHLLASAAIPILFPAVKVGDQYFGDGALRQFAPISPALHLGANRILVIGVSGNVSAAHQRELSGYPSLAQVLGHILNSLFVDTLEGDVERLERINHTLSGIPPQVRRERGITLREVEVLKIYPSEPIDEIAAAHIRELPRTLRFFLRGSGATRSPGATAVSYLLFEPGFTRALIALGYRDAMAREDEIRAFFAPP